MQKIIVIVGPTAVGKTKLAIELAKAHNGELISADSRQVYRGLDIGTAKDKTFPQHLIDVVDLDKEYNVADFVRDARLAIDDIRSRGKLPIIVGGTAFWVDSLVFGYDLPSAPPDTGLRHELEHKPWQELFAMLEERDPQRAKHIDRHNKRRLIRALEIGVTPPLQKKSLYDATWIGIKMDKAELDTRIARRVDEQFTAGLMDEIKSLPNPERFGFVYTAETKEEAVRATVQYSKRQLTWWKRNKEIKWFTAPVSLSEVSPILPG